MIAADETALFVQALVLIWQTLALVFLAADRRDKPIRVDLVVWLLAIGTGLSILIFVAMAVPVVVHA